MSNYGQKKSGPAAAAGQSAEALNSLIERWWADYFPGSAVARNAAAWNAAHAAKEALKRLMIPRTLRGNNPEGSI
jgi:hypothetical protein